ncbi:DNA gyrase inhibitor YacG [Ectothiorhodospiraceae bacterium WFHF3C12]|nr:DNA gyrase inhibitor YacG [Ectothiorhodospiraceae bacterium WFHF3C12]
MAQQPVQARCPACGERYEYSTDNPYRPFCSERCKLVDLGRWFDGSHHIAGPDLDDESIGRISDGDDPANEG